MRSSIAKYMLGVIFFSFLCLAPVHATDTGPARSVATVQSSADPDNPPQHEEEGKEHPTAAHHEDPAPGFLVIPFVVLLLMIATGPLFYEHFWHKNYPIISVILAVIVVVYYLFVLHNVHRPVHHLFEYIQFISLLASLYIASGGIMIDIDKRSTPLANTLILLIGSVIANVIGTTGASMLLIRPFIRLNRDRIQPYHIIFFIFMISNIGGALTPIGDPPLFLGFLKGVPFDWTIVHNLIPWAFAIALLAAMFYFFDMRNKELDLEDEEVTITGKIRLIGTKNFIWLAVVVAAVFLDPNIFDWVPGINYHGTEFSFIREIIMLSIAYLSFRFANKQAHEGNDFTFEPIREVTFIFIGIFGTMMPALELVEAFASSPRGMEMINPNSLYWGTGILSGFLDNAPTYLNFLTAAMASQGASINQMSDVVGFANGEYLDSILDLKAISIAAVFFGAMTYIGNGPNFMVKSIAESVGIRMPTFFGYIIRFSIPLLLPLLLVVWLIFFAFQ